MTTCCTISCYSVITCTLPPYLSDLLGLYIPSRILRSSADNHVFDIPNKRKKFQGPGAFSFVGPSVWSNLPFSVRHGQTLSSFKSQLQTHLFSLLLLVLYIVSFDVGCFSLIIKYARLGLT